MADQTFAVTTVELDLPAVAGAFAGRLHEAGMPVTPARSADVARALAIVHPISRRRLYWTLRSVLVTDQAEVRIFDGVFREVFGDLRSEKAFVPDDDHTVASPEEQQRAETSATRQGASAEQSAGSWQAASPGESDDEDEETDVPLALASDEERLAGRSFDSLDPSELAQLFDLMSRLRLATPERRSRRVERARHGRRIDLRRTLRTSLRTAGEPVRLARRRRRSVPRRLVMLCDISGSMEPYARAYLQFLTCAAAAGPNAEAFVFATRLTRVTRALAARNPERAMQRAAATAPDWSSGTRIGDALKEFNDRHGRRGMARGAVVVILSDGWERGEPTLVGQEMERLARLAHRIVWVNPRVSAREFRVRAGGMVAAMPYCDALVSGHSFRALGEVVDAIGAAECAPPPLPAPAPADEAEPWASAKPVAGSSVAMPSGHGPSKGNTTPGWVTDE